jgi:SAM-dependent methyltransferase
LTPHSDDWDRHWREYSASAEENPAQLYRQRLIAALLGLSADPHLGAIPQVLDIGSGSGDMVLELRRRFPTSRLLGVELSESGVELARRKVPDARFVQQGLLGDALPPPGLRSWATHAVCSEVLEHVDEPAKLLWNARPYLRPGCRLVVTVPGGPRSAFDRHIGHRRHYRIDDLRRLLEGAGLAVETVTGAGFPFFNLYRLVVVARGRRLVDDVAASPDGQPATGAARLVMRAFDSLFRLNLDRSRLGYQIVAVAREPA